MKTTEELRQFYTEEAFIQGFDELQKDAANVNRLHGFNDDELRVNELDEAINNHLPPQFEAIASLVNSVITSHRNARAGLKIALIVGELGEALEAVRKNLGPDDHIPDFSAEEAEIADAVIRIMNYANDRHLRLSQAIVAKNNYNRTRADHSQASRTSEHGKRF